MLRLPVTRGIISERKYFESYSLYSGVGRDINRHLDNEQSDERQKVRIQANGYSQYCARVYTHRTDTMLTTCCRIPRH